jgi:hypothetical protein
MDEPIGNPATTYLLGLMPSVLHFQMDEPGEDYQSILT